MEGMLLRVPVIATRTPVLEEYFSDGENIIFVDPGSVSDLSDKIDLLINNEKMASDISKKAKYKVETQFSHENYVSDLEEFLSKV